MFKSPFSEPSPPALNLAPLQAALFDLDGTLIDVDMQVFVPLYLRRLAERLEPVAEPRRTVATLRAVVMAMLDDTTGDCSLEELLRTRLADELQLDWSDYQAGLADFCREDLPAFRPLVKPHRVRERS